MPQFNIYDPVSNTDRGTYEAADSNAALDLMAKKAGYRDMAHLRAATGTDPDFIVSPVGLHASPEPTTIIARRDAAGLSQSKAAVMVGASLRSWQYWEAGDYKMDPELWQRFNERTAHLIK